MRYGHADKISQQSHLFGGDVNDRFNDLPQMSQPTVQCFGPASLARLMRRSHQIHVVQVGPLPPWSLTRKAFIGNIRAVSRQPSTLELQRGCLTGSKQSRRQLLIVRACASKAEPLRKQHPLNRIVQAGP